MKFKTTLILIFSYFLLSSYISEINFYNSNQIKHVENEQIEIKKIIIAVLNWTDQFKNEESIDVFPVIENDNDSIYKGFNMEKHKQNLTKLAQTNFFSKEFIDNYNFIIIELDKKLKAKELIWNKGETPPFGNDANVWCSCQDVPYDNPNPWDNIEIKCLDFKKGKYAWTWGELDKKTPPDWNSFKYIFKVVKENGNWKISYLQEFDKKYYLKKK